MAGMRVGRQLALAARAVVDAVHVLRTSAPRRMARRRPTPATGKSPAKVGTHGEDRRRGGHLLEGDRARRRRPPWRPAPSTAAASAGQPRGLAAQLGGDDLGQHAFLVGAVGAQHDPAAGQLLGQLLHRRLTVDLHAVGVGVDPLEAALAAHVHAVPAVVTRGDAGDVLAQRVHAHVAADGAAGAGRRHRPRSRRDRACPGARSPSGRPRGRPRCSRRRPRRRSPPWAGRAPGPPLASKPREVKPRIGQAAALVADVHALAALHALVGVAPHVGMAEVHGVLVGGARVAGPQGRGARGRSAPRSSPTRWSGPASIGC